jgi:hypothetical protein
MKQNGALGMSSISDQHNMDIKLNLLWYLLFLHERQWLWDKKKVCETVELCDFKWSTFREAKPVSLCFYSFLRKNKEWHHLMMINLWLLI